jgi:hypothetical protein
VNIRLRYLLLVLFGLFIAFAEARAQAPVTGQPLLPTPSPDDIPNTITYQGALFTRDGSPVGDGLHKIMVRLYVDSVGVTTLWEAEYVAEVKGGFFTLSLGSGNTPLPTPQEMNRPLWLGVAIDNAAELRPLTALGSAPYAINVANSAVGTNKLQDGSVTPNKFASNFVGAILVNGLPVTTKGSSVNLVAGTGVQLRWDAATNSVYITADTAAIYEEFLKRYNGGGGTQPGPILADVDMNGHKIKRLGDPSDDSDATSRGWVLKQLALTSSGDGILYRPGAAQSGRSNTPLMWLDNTGTSPFFRFEKSGGMVAELSDAGVLRTTGLITGTISSNGINNNDAGMTKVGALSEVTTIMASGDITTTANLNANGLNLTGDASILGSLNIAGPLLTKRIQALDTGSTFGTSTSGDGTYITVNGANGGASEVVVKGDLDVTGTARIGKLTSVGLHKFAGSVTLQPNQWFVDVTHPDVDTTSNIIVTYQDLNHLALLTAYISDIVPGVSFTAMLSGPVPEGANAKLHYMIVN